MGNKETKKVAKTPDDDESGGMVVWPFGPSAIGDGVGDDVGVGVQLAGVLPDVGEGVVGGVSVEGGLVGVGAAPGEPETLMANFWPNWQCWPTVQM